MVQKHLYFLRHGIAVARGTPGIPDWERPLTPEGRKRLIQEVKGMKHLPLELDLIWSSPLPRAYQTAEIVQQTLPFNGPLEIREELSPGGDWEKLLELLQARRESRILLAGHEPDFSTALERLLGCSPQGNLLMKKGALACVLLEFFEKTPEAELQFLLPPKVLRRLG
jgi:phosphohistidine phosphatase